MRATGEHATLNRRFATRCIPEHHVQRNAAVHLDHFSRCDQALTWCGRRLLDPVADTRLPGAYIWTRPSLGPYLRHVHSYPGTSTNLDNPPRPGSGRSASVILMVVESHRFGI